MSDFWSGFEGIEVVLYPENALVGVLLPRNEKEFLSSTGFPDSAAPFLAFECSGDRLRSVSEQWNLGEEFQKYKVIGSNGSGDPIAIDGTCGEIVYLNHDNGFERVFMCSSPSKLAQSLKAFRRVIEETLKENGEDAFLDNDIPLNVQERFKKEIAAIDLPALRPRAFWSDQVESMAGGTWD